jgi:excisionase family DNA binding protein
MARERRPADLPAAQVGEIMNVHHVALHCRLVTVYRLIKKDKLPAFRVGSDWRFRREDIDRWIGQREVKPGKGRTRSVR